MISELRKEVLAHFLQRIFFENDFHFHFHFENDFHFDFDFENDFHSHYYLMRTKISHKRDRHYWKVYGVKGVLHVGVLLRYRCVCLGTILALIHPYKQEDFNTLKTHIQSLFS